MGSVESSTGSHVHHLSLGVTSITELMCLPHPIHDLLSELAESRKEVRSNARYLRQMEQISALHILINLGSYEENRTDLNSHRNRGRLADNRTAAVAESGYVTTALLRTLSARLSCPGSKALLWFFLWFHSLFFHLVLLRFQLHFLLHFRLRFLLRFLTPMDSMMATPTAKVVFSSSAFSSSPAILLF